MSGKELERAVRKSRRAYESLETPQEFEDAVRRALTMEREEKAMKKRWNTGRVIGAAAAALCLCYVVGLNTNEAFAAAAARLPIIGGVSRVLTFRTYEKTDADKEIHMEIPEIQPPLQEETSSGFTASVNSEIQRLMNEYEKSAEQHIAEYKEAFLETGGTEEEFTQKNIRVDASYSVKYESGDILSLVITANESWSGAYGVQYFYNMNLKTGAFLTLADLLGDDFVQKANDSIRQQMKERELAEGGPIYWDGSNGMEGFTSISEAAKFYINEKGNPVIVFEKYEIAPGAYGAQEFEIAK